MPTLKRLCTGCRSVIGSGPCKQCAKRAQARKRAADKRRPRSDKRGYGPGWKKKRANYLRENPWCVDCGARAGHVDHVVPLAEGGADDESNYASRCHTCHSRKTMNENRGPDGRIKARWS